MYIYIYIYEYVYICIYIYVYKHRHMRIKLTRARPGTTPREWPHTCPSVAALPGTSYTRTISGYLWLSPLGCLALIITPPNKKPWGAIIRLKLYGGQLSGNHKVIRS